MISTFGLALAASILAPVMPVPSPRASPAEVVATALPAPVLPPVPDIAPDFRSATGPLAPGDIVGVPATPFVGISLESAIAMALANNSDLAVSQSDRRIAGYRIVAASGAYDVRFSIEPSISSSKSASLSAFQVGPGGGPLEQSSFGATAGLAGKTHGGGAYAIDLSASHVNNNATANSYDPYYPTSLNITFTQSLARGAHFDPTRQAVSLAVIGRDTSTAQTRLVAENTIAAVADTYYNLIAAWRNVAIQEDALRQARAQSESNARLVARGAAAPVDVAEADSQVEASQDAVYSAVQNVASLQNALKRLIVTNPADPLWTANIVPTSLHTDLPAEPRVADVLADAIAHRPEVELVRDQERVAAVAEQLATDERKPQIDLQLAYTAAGFAGSATDPAANPIAGIFGPTIAAVNNLIAIANASLPPAQQLAAVSGALPPPQSSTLGGLGTSFSSLASNSYPTYSAQVQFSVPLGNRTARADAAIAGAQERSAAIASTALDQRLIAESRDAVQAYREALARVAAARASRIAAERVLAGEERKFRAGSSTTFLVLQRQVIATTQRGRELTAQTDLERAVVELERVRGTLADRYGVAVDDLGAATAPKP